jgi:sugar lactone lactonase YvrE
VAVIAETWVEGLRFGECPRWRGGRLWLSDFYDHAVKVVGADGRVEVVVEVPGQPAGLGWLPDGRMLVVSMVDRRLLCFDGTRTREHADLGAIATFHCNDLVVDRAGRAYVGNFGFDLERALHTRGVPGVIAEHDTAALARVDPDGSVHRVADGLSFPNGMVVTDDGRLLVAETIAFRITAYDVGPDGLANRRVFAATGGRSPDGLALDAEGGVWFADCLAAACVRVDRAGAVTDVVETDARCFGCALGGDDGRTLFVVGADSDEAAVASATRTSRIWRARVRIPAAAG